MKMENELFITDIPAECVRDCTLPGVDATAAVQHWRSLLDFSVDRVKAIKGLGSYGAWSRNELAGKSDDELAEIVLWLACGTFREYETVCADDGIDPRGDRPEDFDPACGSDLFTLE